MAARVSLVRHAAATRQTTHLNGRAADAALTRMGLQQAEGTAMRLARAGVDAVCTSPTARARATAEIIAGAAGLTATSSPALDEIDFGAWTGAAFVDLDKSADWRRWNADRGRARPPGGESMAEVQLRAAIWLEHSSREGQHVVAVSHGDVIRALVAHVLGLPLHFYDRFALDPASITVVDIDEHGPRLRHLNDTSHVRTD